MEGRGREEAKRRRAILGNRQGGRAHQRRRLRDSMAATTIRHQPRHAPYRPAVYEAGPLSEGPSSQSSASESEWDAELDSGDDWVSANLPELSFDHAFVDTSDVHTQTAPDRRSVAVPARQLPVPVLEPPPVTSKDLANTVACIMADRPDAAPDVLSDLAVGAMTRAVSPPQQRAIQLAVEFGSDLLQASADHLLRATSARFGGLDFIQPSAILTFMADELGVWSRRPSLPRHQASDNLMQDIEEDD